MNLDSIAINRLIIHDVPKHLRSDDASAPILSEVVSPLTEESRTYFRNQIVKESHAEKTFDVSPDDGTQSPIPSILERYLIHHKEEFVDISHLFALHLFKSQNGQNPGGILALLEGHSNTGPILACLKLEREEGIGLRQDEVDGHKTFSADHLKNLVLTQRTKLFKLALFYAKEDGTLQGRVRDSQMGYTTSREVAYFFLNRFLGFKLSERPSITTKRFYEASQFFIQGVDLDPAERVVLMNHLTSELLSNAGVVSPAEFAARCFPEQIADAFLQHLRNEGISIRPFPKDVELISTSLKKTVIQTDHLEVSGTPGDIKQFVTIKGGDDEEPTIIEIQDGFQAVYGHGRKPKKKGGVRG